MMRCAKEVNDASEEKNDGFDNGGAAVFGTGGAMRRKWGRSR